MWKRRGFCWWQGGVGWVEWWGRGTESQWKKPTESLFFFFGYFSCLWNWGIPSRSSSPPPYKMILGFFFPPTNLKSCKVLVKTITNYCGKKSPACLTDWLTTQVENEVHNISIMPWHYITVQVEHIMLSFIVWTLVAVWEDLGGASFKVNDHMLNRTTRVLKVKAVREVCCHVGPKSTGDFQGNICFFFWQKEVVEANCGRGVGEIFEPSKRQRAKCKRHILTLIRFRFLFCGNMGDKKMY